MQKVLVTGANGQLGSEFQAMANFCEWGEFYFVDFPDFDLTNQSQIEETIAKISPDYVINCAAYTAVDKAEEEEDIAFAVNSTGVQNLARVCEKHNTRLIHISTDYVFDGTNCSPYIETDQVKPNSVYGASKLKGENLIFESGCEAIIIRTSWLYSTFGNNFMKTMIRLGKERDSLGVIFDQVGTPTYARHLANAICEIISKVNEGTKEFVQGIYHFSNEGVCSWYDFTTAIHLIHGEIECNVTPIETKDYPTAASRPAYSVLNKTKIKATYGINIPNWWYGLKECIETSKVKRD